MSRKMIRLRAKELSDDDDFKASRGWLERFMSRKRLSLRRKTTVCQSIPADCIPKLVSFITHLRQLQLRHNYRQDETACWMDMPSDTTVNLTGSRSVPLKSTGHEKDHFTVILTARADGTKAKPYVVFKGKGTRLIKDLQCIAGIVVRFSSNGWMNDSLTIDYLHAIIGQLTFHKRLLVWDAYRCHTSEAVHAETSRLRLHTAIVPGGCTKYIQAADVVWNACFKSHMRSCYDTWLSEPGCHEYTRGGNLKPPSRSLLCEWVKLCWEKVPSEMVKESFMSCAITTNTDGSDDHKIHCFKPGQACEAGLHILKEKNDELLRSLDEEQVADADPFASDTDDEVENNEILVDEDDDGEPSDESRSDNE